jgi:catechol 2,3-dioxygenase-like lactoylglutathione lyase family enzyme
MAIENLIPMLYTREIQETVDFHVKVLGFSGNNYQPGNGWASLQLDDVKIMLALPNELIPLEEPAFTGAFYFRTDNVDELWEQLRSKTRVCYGLEDLEYGMSEFAIYDNNGYLLQFGQET